MDYLSQRYAGSCIIVESIPLQGRYFCQMENAKVYQGMSKNVGGCFTYGSNFTSPPSIFLSLSDAVTTVPIRLKIAVVEFPVLPDARDALLSPGNRSS